MRIINRIVIGLLLVVVGVSGASAGASNKNDAEETIQYMSSIPPLAMILNKLVEGRGQVGTLLDPGMSPHTYDPKPSDVIVVNKSEAVFYVGGELDMWAAGIGDTLRIAVFPLIAKEFRIEMGQHSHAHTADAADKHDHGHSHHHHHSAPGTHEEESYASDDPHFWTSPVVVQRLIPSLTQKLIELDPQGAEAYESNAAAFSQELSELDQEIAELLEPYDGGELILFHPSFQYFAGEYGLQVSAVVQPVAGVEPSAKYLVELIKHVEQTEHCALFTEPQLPPDAAETLADATGLSVHELDPLGGTEELDSYVELMRYNANIIAAALGQT